MEDFARLERHDGLQVLARLEEGEGDDGRYGPILVTRCDPSVTIEVKAGPWSDDDEGWDKATEALKGQDLARFAKWAQDMAARFAP